MPASILFRTDASLQIGTGHVMRCLTLADALRAHGARCRFICRGHKGNMIDYIRQRGHEADALAPPGQVVGPAVPLADLDTIPNHEPWLEVDWGTDAMQSVSAAESSHHDWLVVDHYAIDARWESAMRSTSRHLMVIDDLADRRLDCDLLLDQNLGRISGDYDRLVPPACQRIIGPSYALLRPEFGNLRKRSLARRKQPSLRRLLVSLGGVDKDNLTSRVLRALRASKLPPDCSITVVMGANAPALAAVLQLAREMPWATTVLVDAENMADLMTECDLAIGAAGSTTWERCCLGVPSLMIVAADNQRGIASAMDLIGAAHTLGDAQNSSFDQALVESIDAFSSIPDLLHAMTEKAHLLVDGEGAQRVSRAMMSLTQD